MSGKHRPLVGGEDAFINLRPRRVARGVAVVAIVGLLGSETAFNGMRSGKSIIDAYFRQKSPQETYIAKRISVLGEAVSLNCVPSAEYRQRSKNKDIIYAGNVASLSFFIGENPKIPTTLPIIDMDKQYCDQIEESFRSAEQGNYEPSLAKTNSVAIGSILHEYEHIASNESNEATTECHATQRLASRLDILGFPVQISREISATYAVKDYRPPQYLSPECRPGGKLDLHINGDYPLQAALKPT